MSVTYAVEATSLADLKTKLVEAVRFLAKQEIDRKRTLRLSRDRKQSEAITHGILEAAEFLAQIQVMEPVQAPKEPTDAPR